MSSIGSTTQSVFTMSGLSSNLDTASMVQKLMQINSVPQQQLKAQQATYETQLSAYQSLNSSMQAVGTAADALSLPTGWQLFNASSSQPSAVSAVAGSGAVGGSLTFSVGQLATAAAVASSGTVASTAAVVSAGTLLLSQASSLGFSSLAGSGLATGAHNLSVDASGNVSLDGGSPVQVVNGTAGQQVTLVSGSAGGGTITATLSGPVIQGNTTVTEVATGSGSLADLVNAVNAAGAGVTAAAVQTAPGAFKLQLSASATGQSSNFTLDPAALSGGLGAMAALTLGQDASIRVGNQAGQYTVTSSTNSITGVMPGVTLSLLGAGSGPVTVTVNHDAAGMASQVGALVAAVNATVSKVGGYTSFDPTGAKTGPLIGDASASRMAQDLQRAVLDAVGGSSLADASSVGITINSDGTLAFNQSKFTAAFAANPAAVQSLFIKGSGATATGIAQRLQAASTAATDFTSGYLTAAINGAQSEINSLGKQIDWWTPVLAEEQATLAASFTAMETALSQVKSQGSALAAALGQQQPSSSSSGGTLSSGG